MRWDDEVRHVSQALQRKMEAFLLDYDDDLIDIAFYHSETMNIEISRNANGLIYRHVATAATRGQASDLTLLAGSSCVCPRCGSLRNSAPSPSWSTTDSSSSTGRAPSSSWLRAVCWVP